MATGSRLIPVTSAMERMFHVYKKLFVISFSNKGDPFSGVCLFCNFVRNICTERDSVSDCTYGKSTRIKSSLYFEVKGIDAGADDYLVKPVNSKRLLVRINRLLRRTDFKP